MKKNKSNTVLRHKVILWLIAIISFCILISAIFINLYLDSFVKEKIEKSVHQSSQGLYSLKIGKLNAHFWTGAIEAENLLLHQDTAVLRKLQVHRPGENISDVHINVRSVKIHHTRWVNYLLKKDLEVGKIFLESPELVIKGSSLNQNIRSSNKKFIDLLPGIIAGFAGSLKIEEMIVQSGNFRYDIYGVKGITSQIADSISINLKDILIDTIPSKKVLYSENIRLSLNNYKLKTPDEAYSFTIARIDGVLSDSVWKISQLYFVQKDSLNPDRVLTKVSVKDIQGEGVNFRDFFYQKKITMNKIIIESPDISSLTDTRPAIEKKENQRENRNKFLVPAFISDVVQSFKINTISVRNGNIKSEILSSKGTINQKADKIFIDIIKVAGKAFDSVELFTPKNINIQFKNYKLTIGKQRFSLHIGSADISSKRPTAFFQHVKIIQDHPPGIEANHYISDIKSIQVHHFDIMRALNKSEISVEVADVNNMNIEFLLHEGKAFRPEYAKIMPNEIAGDLDFYLNIKQVNFNNTYISYSDDTGEKPLLFTFEKTTGRISNLTNDPKYMTFQKPAVLSAETWILGVGKLNLTVSVPLLSPDFICDYNGTFEGMDINGFNNVLSFAGVKVESGRIAPSTFSAAVSGGVAKGEMQLIYNDLHVKVLDKEGEVSKLKSLIGNFIIKDSNPNDKNEKPEIISIKGNRKPEDSFFSFLWRPLQEGIIKLVTKDSAYPK